MIDRIVVVPRDLLLVLAGPGLPSDPVPQARAPSSPSCGSSEGQYSSPLMVESWLNDQGIAYRVKSEPDGKGRTVYVLKQCPFHPDHGDPDSCIMQDVNGKMSAHCFHNSCQGHGWQDFKNKIGAPEAKHYDPPLTKRNRRSTARDRGRTDPTEPAGEAGIPSDPDGHSDPTHPTNGWPRIQGNRRQLRAITEDAYQAILTRNDPPTLFVRGEVLTRLRISEENGTPICEPLTDHALRGALARAADWTKLRDTKHGEVEDDAPPPMEVVKDLAALPTWPRIPILHSVIETPVYGPTGMLVNKPGYNPGSKLWYHPAPDFDLSGLGDPAECGTVEWAREFLLEELLGDFPFRDSASRAHALATLILPFVRRMIDGPTPLHLLDAPVEGTGKTLLASVISIVTTGRDVEAIAEATCDEEWRKRITSVLAEGPTIILLDNLSRTLDSGALAAVLTSRLWKDRILGVSKTVRLPNSSLWLASGNNTRLSRELIRRTIWCRLDAQTDAPWERQDFRHPNLIGWTKQNRGKLVMAVLTLCRCWIDAGCPPGKQTLGMFESWAQTIGGILDVAGLPGLLANAQEFRAARADQVGEWRAFVKAWWSRFQEEKVGVESLFLLVAEETLLDSVLGDKGERSQRIRLGQALARSVDRVYGDYRIESCDPDHKERQQYRLRPIGRPTA